jgi:hypothetical protein
MSEICELIDTELDAVCGGHHGHYGRAELRHPAFGQDFTPHGYHGNQGHSDFGNVTFNLGNTIDITGGSGSSSVTVNGGVNGGSNRLS